MAARADLVYPALRTGAAGGVGAVIRLVAVQKVERYIELLYDMLKERSGNPDINISHASLPSFTDHKKFVLKGPYHRWYFGVGKDNKVIGAIYMTTSNEIGIQVLRAHQGQGYGKQMLRRFLDEHQPLPAVAGMRSGRFVANINPNNEVSIKLFTGMGAKLMQHTYRFD